MLLKVKFLDFLLKVNKKEKENEGGREGGRKSRVELVNRLEKEEITKRTSGKKFAD